MTLTALGNNLYNTGYDGNTFDSRPAAMTPGYTPLPDSHYSIVAIFHSTTDVPSTVFLPTPQVAYQAYAQNTANGIANGWNVTGPTRPIPGQWISFGATTTTSTTTPTNYIGPANTVYDYRLGLTNIPLGYKLTITGTTTSDNALLITANGNSTSFFANQTSFNNNTNSYMVHSDFNISLLTLANNYVDFNVLNDGSGGPTGLQVFDLSGTAVPLDQAVSPATLMMILQSGVYTSSQVMMLIDTGVLPSATSGFFTPTELTTLLNSGALPSAILAPPSTVQVSPNGHAVENALNNINSSGATTPAFVELGISLLNVASGPNSTAYDVALRSLSPEILGALSSQAFDNDSFMTLDLDDYLAHRRTDAGNLQVCAGGIDTSGLQVNRSMDSTLSPIKNHLDSQPLGQPEELSKSPNQKMEEDCDCEDRINMFIRGEVILSQNFSGDGLDHLDHTEGTTTSAEVGADYQIGKNWLVGALFSYDHTESGLDEEGSSDTTDGYAPGIYASYAEGGWFANGLATFRRNLYSTDRVIQFDTVNTNAYAEPQGTEEMVYMDGGYEFHQGDWTYGPMLGLMYNHLNIESFDESGAGVADLNVGDETADSLRSRLGGRVSCLFKSGNTLWTPHLDASWQHEYLDDARGITSSFSAGPSNSFTVYTPGPDRDAALIGVGVDGDLSRDVTTFFNYQVQAGQDHYFGQMLQAGVKLAF